MIIPIRCFTCGKLIADKWEDFQELKKQKIPMDEIFKKLDLERYCCKRMLISHVDLIDDVLKFTRQQ
ncbi:MAG: DNA-directed RNA polymerase subunit N [Promethearchaeota archaeon]